MARLALLLTAALARTAIALQPPLRRALLRAPLASAAPAARAEAAPKCPLTNEGQLLAARDAIVRAAEDGVSRQQVRTLLLRDGELIPPDETWQGGIMQLYKVCAPLARDILRAVGAARSPDGARPAVREQRIDASGVDGEALMVAEAADARFDASAFVQPSLENQKEIEAVAAAAGPRLVLTVNPQFRDTEDTLDFIASKAGFLGQLGGFLGGKADFTKRMKDLGFRETFSLQEFVVKGTQVRIYLAYPYRWQIYAPSDANDEPAVKLGECDARPDYNVIAKVLTANAIEPKLYRDLNRGKALVQGAISTFYEDIPADDA